MGDWREDIQMSKKVWNEKKLNQAKYLVKCHSTRKVVNIFNTTKNAVIGALYRDKVNNGYVPSPDSKYIGPKNIK